MSTATSVEAYPLVVGGRRARSIDPDPALHTAETEGRFWSPSPFVSGRNLEWEDGAHLRPITPEPERVKQPPTMSRGALAEQLARETEEPEHEPPSEQVTPRKYDYFDAAAELWGALKPNERLVLQKLWRHADGNLRNARPTKANIARYLGWTGKHAEADVQKILRSLERHGFIVCTSVGSSVNGVNLASVYRLTLPDGEG